MGALAGKNQNKSKTNHICLEPVFEDEVLYFWIVFAIFASNYNSCVDFTLIFL